MASLVPIPEFQGLKAGRYKPIYSSRPGVGTDYALLYDNVDHSAQYFTAFQCGYFEARYTPARGSGLLSNPATLSSRTLRNTLQVGTRGLDARNTPDRSVLGVAGTAGTIVNIEAT